MDSKFSLESIFTTVNKDFFTVEDFEDMAGIGYEVAAKLIREIKSTSDVFGLKGRVHRVDYYNYINYRQQLLSA